MAWASGRAAAAGWWPLVLVGIFQEYCEISLHLAGLKLDCLRPTDFFRQPYRIGITVPIQSIVVVCRL